MPPAQFQKRVEDFTCAHCGVSVAGSGFTNHCPKCLWSMHVDVHPGDRAEACLGLMEPVRLEGSSPDYTIVHRCRRCGLERRNKAAANDDEKALLTLAGRA